MTTTITESGNSKINVKLAYDAVLHEQVRELNLYANIRMLMNLPFSTNTLSISRCMMRPLNFRL
jgi:hypothetical protein